MCFNNISGSQAGWHTLVTQVSDQKVRYFVDGKAICRAWRELLPGRHDVDKFQSLVYPRWNGEQQ